MAKENLGNEMCRVVKGLTGSTPPTAIVPPRGGSVMTSGSSTPPSGATQGNAGQGNGQTASPRGS
jgi:hypothetical protein